MAIDVLVLDDSAVMRKIVARTLRASGLGINELWEASNGDEALALIQGGKKPTLILSDVNMNGMDGITFARHARALLPTTKIVMITTEGGSDKIAAAMAAGANAYLTKPFTPEQIAEKLTTLHLA